MAVCRGGKLHVDLEDDFPGASQHSVQGTTRHAAVHDVIIDAASLLAGIAGGLRLAVNSRHHQGVAEPGHQVRVAATAPDSVIEAIEWADRDFAIGVQWHPEDHAAAGDTFSRRLFSMFADASARARTRRQQL
jgi:putative glutamine amidotransferase